MRARCYLVFLFSAVYVSLAQGQLSSLPLFEEKIVTAFNPLGLLPVSVALTGTATWVSGAQHDSGTIQLELSPDGAMKESWSFAKVSRTLVTSPLSLADLKRTCSYTDADAKQRTVVGPNCFQGVPWFFPSFVLKPVYGRAVTILDATGSDESSQGLAKLKYTTNAPPAAGAIKPVVDTLKRLQEATAATIYYDTQTALPTKLVYRQALDNDEARSVEVSVAYSGYSPEAGFMVPHHIQRYVQRTLQLDLTITRVSIQ